MTTQVGQPAGWRKIAIQATIGAIVGASGSFAVLSLMNVRQLDWAPSYIFLASIGLIYVLMGLIVGIGTLAPRLLGQRLLNVADADEIIEERSNMGSSATGITLVGAALMLLAYAVQGDAAGTATIASPATAFWLLLAVLILFTGVSIWMWQRFDELWRQLTVEMSALTGNLLMAITIVWGGGAAAGLISGPRPLDLVSLAFGLILFASFVAAGRRGMMAPR